MTPTSKHKLKMALSKHQHAQGVPLTNDCDILCEYDFAVYNKQKENVMPIR